MSHLLDLSESGPKYAMVDPVPDDFPSDAFTLSMYVCTDDQRASALFSYGVEGGGYDANELLLFQPRDLGVWIAGQSHSTGVDIADGRLHAVVLTWDRATGAAKLYVDGLPVAGWAASGRALRGGGCLIIGQDQDERGGGFAEGNALRGTVGHITLWADVRVPTAARPLCDGLLDPDDAPVVHISPATADLRGLAWQPPRRVDLRPTFGALGHRPPPADLWHVGDVFEPAGPMTLGPALTVSARVKIDATEHAATLWSFGPYLLELRAYVGRTSDGEHRPPCRFELAFGSSTSSAPGNVVECRLDEPLPLADGRVHDIVLVHPGTQSGAFGLYVDGSRKGTFVAPTILDGRLRHHRFDRNQWQQRFLLGRDRTDAADPRTAALQGRIAEATVWLAALSVNPTHPLGDAAGHAPLFYLTPPSDDDLAFARAFRSLTAYSAPVDGSAFGDDVATDGPDMGQGAALDTMDPFTISFWLAVYPEHAAARSTHDIVEYQSPGGSLAIALDDASIHVTLDGVRQISADRPVPGSWVFVALVGEGDRLELFVGGASVGSLSTDWRLVAGGRLRMGGRSTVAIRELAIWDRAPAIGERIDQVPVTAREDVVYVASAETAAPAGIAWSDEGWLTFDTPPAGHVAVDPVPVGFPGTAWSASFWLRTAERGHEGTVFSYRTQGEDALILLRPHALKLHLGGSHVVTSVDVADDRWHFVALTWHSTTGAAVIFVDGSEAWSGVIARGARLPDGGCLVVGQEQDARGAGFTEHQALRGSVAGLSIWSHVLSAESVREVMAGDFDGATAYLRVAPDNSTIDQAAWSPATALAFDGGRHARAVVADVTNMPTHRWTVSFWVRCRRDPDKPYRAILSYALDDADNELLVMRPDSLDVWVGDIRHGTDVDIADNQWHFVAITQSDGSLSVVVDGVRGWRSDVGFRPIRPGGTLVIGQDQDRLGGGFDPSQAFVGRVCDVAVWARPLSRETVLELMERPSSDAEPGLAFSVSARNAALHETTWSSDQIHPAFMRMGALRRLRLQLEERGLHLPSEAFVADPHIRGELRVDPDIDDFGGISVSGGIYSGPVSIDVDDIFDGDSRVRLTLSPEMNPFAVLAAVRPRLLRDLDDPAPILAFDRMLGAGISSLALTIDPDPPSTMASGSAFESGLPGDRTSIALTGTTRAYGLVPASFSLGSTFEVDGIHQIGDGDHRVDLRVSARIWPLEGLEHTVDCTLFGGRLAFGRVAELQDRQARIAHGLRTTEMPVPDGAGAPFARRGGTVRLTLSRALLKISAGDRGHAVGRLEARWTFEDGGYIFRVTVVWMAGHPAPQHFDLECEGEVEGHRYFAHRKVRFGDLFTDDLDASVEAARDEVSVFVDFHGDVAAVRDRVAGSGSLDLVDMVDALVGETPGGLDVPRGIVRVTDLETEFAIGGTRVTVSGQVEILGVPGGGIEVDLSYRGARWVFDELRATSALSYADTSGILEVRFGLRAWLGMKVLYAFDVSVGVFDDLLRVAVPVPDLSLPVEIPDLLKLPGVGLPSWAAELDGALELSFDAQSIAVAWKPTVSADFWIGELSADAELVGEVSHANNGRATLKGSFSVSVFGQELEAGPVSLSVDELGSVSGLAKVFLRAAEKLISEFNPADFAIRFVLGVGEALWDAAGAAIEAVGDVLGLSGEEEGSKVGFMEFVRTAVMWKGRYYFFHGAKDTVWCINDRDVDGDWPKSASGSWTHMPVIGQGNPLRNILKVRASVSGTTRTLLVLDFARGAIGRSYIIGEPFERALTVRWHGKARLPDDIHTSIYWVGKGTFVFHGDGLVSKVSATVSGSTLKLTMSGTERVTKANGWWDAEDFTVVPACAVEGDRDGGADDTDKLYFFDFRTDRFIRCSHPANSSPSSKLTIDADFPRKITTGWL